MLRLSGPCWMTPVPVNVRQPASVSGEGRAGAPLKRGIKGSRIGVWRIGAAGRRPVPGALSLTKHKASHPTRPVAPLQSGGCRTYRSLASERQA